MIVFRRLGIVQTASLAGSVAVATMCGIAARLSRLAEEGPVRRAPPPGRQHRPDKVRVDACSRVYLQVVGPERVNAVDLDMRAPFADPPIAAVSLPPIEFVKVAMHANQVDVQAREERRELTPPGRELDDVLHDQVVTGIGESGQAAVESSEEPGPHLMPPVEGTAMLASPWNEPGVN